MKILVTGGAGYIGSHAVKALLNAGHDVVVYDNLSHGSEMAIDPRARFVRGSTLDLTQTATVLRLFSIEAVLHFAAFIEVAESMTEPGKYFENNTTGTLHLLEAMKKENCRQIVFSSTAAVYGTPRCIPIPEIEVCRPINPYGRSKWMSEMMIQDYCQLHGFSAAILRYFNVAGAWPTGEIGEDHQPETHLIPRILKASLSGEGKISIYGTRLPTSDGTCIRDYVHVVDLVEAHLLALDKLKPGNCEIFNVGSESGFSVRQVITACEKVTGRKLLIEEHAPRAGDPVELVASSEKIRRVLGWKRKYPDLEQIIDHAWRWHWQYPDGYQKKPHRFQLPSEVQSFTPPPMGAPAQRNLYTVMDPSTMTMGTP
jgi:UDP-glucose 4-epimerase